MRIAANYMQSFIANIFKREGFSQAESSVIAATLIDADLRGISSHGVQRLEMYTQKIAAGKVVPGSHWHILQETKTSVLIDAQRTSGQLVAVFTLQQLIQKAHKNGIAIGVVRNATHFGAAGYYARMAANAGLVGISATNTNPLLVPPHARVPFLGSNPFAFAFPTTTEPFVFDAATSTVSLGKIEVLLKNKKKVPGEWAIDAHGKIEKDPQAILAELSQEKRSGGILPLGGKDEANGNYKGFGNALVIECLTALLAQGSFSADLGNGNYDISHFFLVFDPALFGELTLLEKNLESMLARIRALQQNEAAPGLVPGDKENQNYLKNLTAGIVIDDTTYAEINKIAAKLGLPSLAITEKREEDGLNDKL
ncbi:Ldh family oxidoreductase [Liquorilactobacillus satsumensis]|uniref:Ldh family oxidoreductase n=1 Tax=Liquorilactobacillus satsumensis TaxID=259059 RepID=UPI001E44F001|nr:Ldh family oxidoreductase [Liquorilactobacillus satsumensis]